MTFKQCAMTSNYEFLTNLLKMRKSGENEMDGNADLLINTI